MTPGTAAQAHEARRSRLLDAMREGGTGPGAPVALAKRTSNLFRDREAGPRRRIDLDEFDHVIDVDVSRCTVEF